MPSLHNPLVNQGQQRGPASQQKEQKGRPCPILEPPIHGYQMLSARVSVSIKDLRETSLCGLELEQRAGKMLFLQRDCNKLVKTLTAINNKKTAIKKKEEGRKRSKCTSVGIINSVLKRELVKIVFIWQKGPPKLAVLKV